MSLPTEKLAEYSEPLAEAMAHGEKIEEGRGFTGLFEGAAVELISEAIEEAQGGERTLGKVQMTAGKADIINRNRRFYPKKVYELATARAQPLIREGIFLGEVDHPMWQGGTLERAAARFTRVWMEGTLMKAEAVILDTDGGRHLRALLDGGVGVQVSTRGYGTITPEKMTVDGVEIEVGVVGENYAMEGIDFVLFASNPHGRVHKESQEPKKETSNMTLEELRSKHPELVAQVEEAAREGMVTREDHEAQVNEAKDAAREEGRTEAMESEEVQRLKGLLRNLVEALKPFVPELQKAEEEAQVSEAEQKVSDLEAKIADLTGRLESVEKERNELKEAKEKADREAEIQAKVDEVLEGYIHADLLRDDLLKLESVEQVEEVFGREKARLESLAARLGVKVDESGKGQGKVPTQEDETPPSVKEHVTAQRKLAGLS